MPDRISRAPRVSRAPSAAVLIIGNEILSGRTSDSNLSWLAQQLGAHGISLREARVVRDQDEAIIAALDHLRGAFDHVFTTGGIGPTHDDITARCIAAAFGVDLVLHERAHQLLRAHYGKDLNAARKKMAMIPQGARLIDNPISRAPGFTMGNVHVLAGVPAIMQAMVKSLLVSLAGGAPLLSLCVSSSLPEGTIAEELCAIQKRNKDLEIGSYPWFRSDALGVNVVVRGDDPARLQAVADEVCRWIRAQGGRSDIMTLPGAEQAPG